MSRSSVVVSLVEHLAPLVAADPITRLMSAVSQDLEDWFDRHLDWKGCLIHT
jgi:hypothetical protein